MSRLFNYCTPFFITLIKRFITSMVLIGAGLMVYYYLPVWVMPCVVVFLLILVLVLEWPSLVYVHDRKWWWCTLLYPMTPFVLLALLSGDQHGRFLVFTTFVVVALFDTGSFMVGNWCGHTLLAPSISPGKTIEGVLGGYVTVLISIIWWKWTYIIAAPLIAVGTMVMIAFVISILALMGDLFESWLKRIAGKKDSGTLLPGHGGILDRVDGVLFVIPFVYVTRHWLLYFLY